VLVAPPPPPIVDVRPAIEIRTASPVNEVVVDGSLAATLVGETPAWEYVLVWSSKGVVVRAILACDRQESDLVLAGDRFAHVCFEGTTNTVLTATFRRTRSVSRLHTSAFVVLAGHGSLIAGSAGSTLWRFDAGSKAKLRKYGAPIVALDVDGSRILVGRSNTALELVSQSGKTLRRLKLPHLGRALLRGARIGSIANHHVFLSDLHGKTVRKRPVVGDATLVDLEANLVVYSVGIRLHLLRLGDGHDVTLRFKGQFGYASAKLSRGGLFYTYNVRGTSRPGRAGFVPAAAVRKLLRR
jgi:hypothetical protein